MRLRTRTLGREEGQATVEFAIVVPLLLLLVIGILEFGKAFNYWIDLNHLANEGARWAAVDKVPPYSGAPQGISSPNCDDMKAYLLSQIGTNELQSHVVDGASPPSKTANIILKVDKGDDGVADIGDAVTVTIQAPNYSVATLSSVLGDLGQITLAGKSTMRLEQVPTWMDPDKTSGC